MNTKVLAGTKKGLFTFSKVGDHWQPKHNFEGKGVFSIGKSEGKLWTAPFTEWTGTEIMFSEDNGTTWNETNGSLTFPEYTDVALAKVWQIEADLNGKLYFGVEPAALFTSENNGETFELCEGLWNHPHRAQWQPGFGGLCLHTIQLLSDKHRIIAVSSGGAYVTNDNGKTWEAANRNIVAPFLPEPTPEFGQCVHKIARDPLDSNQLFLQHHWGVYRSNDAGKNWANISEGKNLPTDFGFACVSNRANTAFILPINSDQFRVFPEGKMGVYRTQDAGETWQRLENGLPQENAFDCVLRDNFSAADENRLAIGTTGGSLYVSEDNGDSWETIAEHLPRITCVRIY
ncbi:MAG: WD40/YVTN/BNR-like repeat-containing protein [Pyrinomonadaceae bacterium]